MMFRVFCAVFILHDRGIVHNDLHFENILVKPLQEAQHIYCRLGSSYEYSITIYSQPLVYDFDLAQDREVPNLYAHATRKCPHDYLSDIGQLCVNMSGSGLLPPEDNPNMTKAEREGVRVRTYTIPHQRCDILTQLIRDYKDCRETAVFRSNEHGRVSQPAHIIRIDIQDTTYD